MTAENYREFRVPIPGRNVIAFEGNSCAAGCHRRPIRMTRTSIRYISASGGTYQIGALIGPVGCACCRSRKAADLL